MNAKYLIASLVIFILWMLGGFAVHGQLLADEYLATGLMRPVEEQQQYFVWMIIAHLVMAAAFVWIYARGREAKPWLGQGVRFGIAVSLLTVVPLYLIYYTVQPVPGVLVVRQIAYDTIVTVILGIAVAWLYREKAAA